MPSATPRAPDARNARNRDRRGRVLDGVQRHGRGGGTAAPAYRIRLAGTVLLSAYLAFAGWLALRPLSVPWVAPANLQPLATIRSDLAAGSPEALADLAGGLLLLAPLGVLMPLAAGRLLAPLPGTWARTVAGGSLISSMVLLLQSGVPGHVVDVDSVLLNTAGIALTCLLAFPPLRARLRRSAGLAPGPGGAARGSAPHASFRGPAAQDALLRREDAGQGASPRTAGVGIAP